MGKNQLVFFMSIIIIVYLLAGQDNYTSQPIIYGATDSEMNIINNALDNTNENVVHSIKAIYVIDNIEIDCDGSSLGCVDLIESNHLEAEIQIVSEKNYAGLCNTFESVVYHEIGHVVDAYYNGIKDSDDVQEIYAEKYSNAHSIEKCDTEGYKKLDIEIEEINRSINELEITCNKIDNILSNWDKYGDTIPYELYNQYTADYDSYSHCIEEYTEKIDLYNELVDEQYSLLL